MAINFPASPTLHQIFTTGESSFIWNGGQWVGYSTTLTVNYDASSIILTNNDVVVGATTTLNFDNTFNVSYSSGISTVSTSLVGLASEGYVDSSIVGLASEGYVDSSIVGFITSGALSGLASEGYVDSAVVGLASEGYVNSAVFTYWSSTEIGIHTLSNVGIGTTNPTETLTVSGVTSTTSLFSTNSVTIDSLIIAQDSLLGTGNIKIGDANTLGAGSGSNYNIGIGQGALANIKNGNYSIAIGYEAANQTNIGDIGTGYNIAIGYQAFKNLKSGSTNIAIGNQALFGSTDIFSNSGGNIAIGAGAGYATRLTRFNMMIGENSGRVLDTGDFNTFFGYYSAYNVGTGNSSIYIGSLTGKHTNIGPYRVVIGSGNGAWFNREFDTPTSGSKELAIGFNDTGISEYWLVGNSSLNVGIGNTNPQYKLDVGGDINFTGTLYQNGSPFSGGGGGLSGIDVRDEGSSVGIATAINFGTGLSVSTVSAGIATVTAIPTNNFYDGGIVTGNINLTSANKNQLIAVSTGSSITINLPAGSGLSPGDGFTIVDVGSSETSSGNAATFNITVNADGSDRILGGSGPLVIDENGASVKLVWMGSTYDWRIV